VHKELIEEPINVGFVCGAVICDGRWYRVEVTDMENYPEIAVILLDKGCLRTVNATEIRRLSDGLDQAAATFISVSFSKIHPQSGNGWALFCSLHYFILIPDIYFGLKHHRSSFKSGKVHNDKPEAFSVI